MTRLDGSGTRSGHSRRGRRGEENDRLLNVPHLSKVETFALAFLVAGNAVGKGGSRDGQSEVKAGGGGGGGAINSAPKDFRAELSAMCANRFQVSFLSHYSSCSVTRKHSPTAT